MKQQHSFIPVLLLFIPDFYFAFLAICSMIPLVFYLCKEKALGRNLLC
jgi:uncharacterized membrane protein YfhO